ncbi:hypothetical protein L484_010177 [Morus notabilis]|uniref:Uncharacterized protein n=1 Tax=Morus notabilis TaxID=981085 RepID=W9QQC5_9ROSA|nr:hypothetical protein L484_010177 [Morus notabilis]
MEKEAPTSQREQTVTSRPPQPSNPGKTNQQRAKMARGESFFRQRVRYNALLLLSVNTETRTTTGDATPWGPKPRSN